jgi:hypothetical protein
MIEEADERLEVRYRLKRKGVDLKRVAEKVAGLYGLDAGDFGIQACEGR